MKIVPFLKEERICLTMEAQSKEEAIKKMGELIRDAEEVVDFDGFMNDVFEREKLSTTGIGKEVAIPHARTDNVKKFLIAIGKFPDGVDFQSIDKKPVKLVFLMGTPKEEGLDEYLKILAHLTRIIDKESFRNSLILAQSPQEVIEAFRRIEE